MSPTRCRFDKDALPSYHLPQTGSLGLPEKLAGELSMPLTEEEKTFQNPKGYWSHDGGFTVEIVEGIRAEDVVPASASLEGNQIRVKNGRVKQTIGGIQLYGRPHFTDPFCFGYDGMVCIRKDDGTLLWRNYNIK